MTAPHPVGLTMAIAGWVAALDHADLPDAVTHHAKRVILDYLAATIPGSASAAARAVQDYLATVDGSGANTRGAAVVVGTSLRFSPPNAALANGTAAHGLEIDDGYTPGAFHPGSPNLAAILAVAEARHSPPEDILLATAIGFEVSCRLAAAGHPATWRRGFHNTPLAGVLGATAAVSRLLGSNALTVGNALGLAGSHAGGLFEFLGRGAEVKRLHAGKAARDGVVCAELATRGLTGPVTVLEGPHGYIHAFADDEFDSDLLVDGLGSRWLLLDTYVKPYPCCRHLHGPIDAVLHLHREAPIDLDRLRSIRVETYPAAARHRHREVVDLLDAQMSIPYAVAVALRHGVPDLDHFGDDARRDPQVARLAGLVEVAEADDCTRDYPAMRPARVILETDDGTRAHRVDQPLGEPGNPVSDADLEAKMLRLGADVLGSDACKRIVEATWSLTAPQELFALLGAS